MQGLFGNDATIREALAEVASERARPAHALGRDGGTAGEATQFSRETSA